MLSSPAPTPEDAETKALREKIKTARALRSRANADLQQAAQMAVDSVGAPTPDMPTRVYGCAPTRVLSPIPEPIMDEPINGVVKGPQSTAQFRAALLANRASRKEGLTHFKKTTQMAVETVRESRLYSRVELAEYMDEEQSEESNDERAKADSGAGPIPGLKRT